MNVVSLPQMLFDHLISSSKLRDLCYLGVLHQLQINQTKNNGLQVTVQNVRKI